MYKHMFIYIYW